MMTTAKLVLVVGLTTTAAVMTALGGCAESGTDTDEPGTTTTPTGNPCPVGQQFCEGECTKVEMDPDHCGQCGFRCQPGQVCSQSTCGSECSTGMTPCGAVCVNLQTDQQNCGSCGHACPAGEVCDGAGQCQLSCPTGQLACGSSCVNANTDNAHCGQCNRACTAPQFCNGAGECGTSCQGGLLLCGTICINPLTDEDYCGASGDCAGANAGDACGQAEVCNNGDCQAVTCNDQWEQVPGENDTELLAAPLAAEPISDCADSVTQSGVVNGAEDVDWYVYQGDDSTCIVNPRQWFDQASSDARLCAFFECVDPEATTQFTCPSGASAATSPAGRFGCCVMSANADFVAEDVNCTGTWSEDLYVYLRVDEPTGSAGTCTSYVLEYNY